MATRGMQKLSAEWAQAAAWWAKWRQTRELGTRIPESLWKLALEQAAPQGVIRTAIALRVDCYALKKRLDVQMTRRRADRTGAAAPAFVELTYPSLTTARAAA